MIKQMAVVTRRPGMTHEEFVEYVKHIHGYQITCSNPMTLVKYVQNYVFDGAYGTKNDVYENGYKIIYSRDSITELYFEDEASMAKTFVDPYVANVVGPDGPNFSDLGKSLPFLLMEKEIEVPNPSAGGVKIFYFMKKNDSISSEKFTQLWFESHQEILNNSATVRNQLKKFVHNVQLSAGEADYFGSKDAISYDGIATMWFENTAAFRTYQMELAELGQQKDNFIDQSQTFFLYTDPLTIYEKK